MNTGVDDTTSVGCVAAIVSCYQDGLELLHDIKERQREKLAQHGQYPEDKLGQDLELSMARGQDVVRSQYDRDFKRLGGALATGDQIARDTLKDISVRMQKQVISQLKLAWSENTHVDFLSLQDVSDDSQDRAIMAIMQLSQRLLVAAPIEVISGAANRSNNLHSSKTQGFIDDAPTYRPTPRRYSQQTFGNYVEISAGNTNPQEKSFKSRLIPAFMKVVDDRPTRSTTMRDTAKHFEYQYGMPYNRNYDSKGGVKHYEQRREELRQDNQRQAAYHVDQPSIVEEPARHDIHLAPPDSPTVRHSTFSSVSSFGSNEPDHPEYNPWATGDEISPLSSMAQEIASGNPFINPLVPEALAPRRPRDRDSQATLHSRATSTTLNATPEASPRESENYNTDPYAEEKARRPWVPTDEESMYNYYGASSPNESATYNNQRNYFENREQVRSPPQPGHREQTRSSSNLTYSWLPSQQPDRWHNGASPPPARMRYSPPRPDPPMEHERPFYRSPPDSGRSLPLHEGPPPTAPPDRPIPVPAPRVPARAANRPRGYSNLSGSSRGDSNNSPVTPATPSMPPTPRSFEAPIPVIPQSQGKPLGRQMSVMSTSTATTTPSANNHPPIKVVPPTTTGGPKAHLPSEANKYAGFCKGAWRAQIGDTKKTWDERSRPAGMYGGKLNQFFKCQKCQFEGRSIKAPGRKKGSIDKKVYGSNGILYRWEFLFKSHVHCNMPQTGMSESHFGCMFCCAQGKGTPVFAGVAALLGHLQEHRELDMLPEGEIVYRMHAIVGRSPAPEEDFQIALPALVI